jgi:hypothetical protein
MSMKQAWMLVMITAVAGVKQVNDLSASNPDDAQGQHDCGVL